MDSDQPDIDIEDLVDIGSPSPGLEVCNYLLSGYQAITNHYIIAGP